MHMPRFFSFSHLSTLALAIACGASPGWALSPGNKPVSAKEPITLNFVNAEIDAVARTAAAFKLELAELAQRTENRAQRRARLARLRKARRGAAKRVRS